MNHTTFTFTSSDGLELFGRAWTTNQTEIKGIVNLVHGIGEHSGRYAHLAEALTEAGYHLVGYDLRGHGLSEGKRGHTPDFDQLLTDIESFLSESHQKFGGYLPAFLYGHSLGALQVLKYGLKRSIKDLAGVIATDPSLALAFAPSPIKLFFGKIMAQVFPSITMNSGLDQNMLSRDKAVVKAYQDDALVHNQVSAKLAMEMFSSGDYVLEHAHEWNLPLLLMHGTADGIAAYTATQEFAQKDGDSIDLVLWEGYYHEIHNDFGKEAVIAKIISWLDAHSNP